MKNIDYQSLKKMIVESGMATPEEICGCSNSYISELETQYGKLPGAYRAFLSAMGSSSDNIFYSVNLVYPSLEKFRSQAVRILQESNVKLAPTAFVFLLTDTMFLFFDIKDGEDSAVLRYREGHAGAEKIYDSFSEWLVDFVSTESKLEEQNNRK